ncbi:MAG: hypothetical protein ABS36_16280 [Acidobacteria bacterium SCN 69-37]|nr:MAG: hypothetical protein ABS36_16280 [Acidobacteria bacterium SCN 69-37]
MTTADRRAHVRVDPLGQIEAHSVWRLQPLHLRELSETGFSLESMGPFDPDAIHKFRIGLDGSGRSVIVQARACHTTVVKAAGGLAIHVTGFELVHAGDRVRREILALLRFVEEF